MFGVENWRWLPIIWAIVPFFNIFFFAKVPLRVLVEESERVPLTRLFKAPVFWLFIVLMICAGASEQAMSQWSSMFAESGLGVSKTVGDLLGPCMFAAMMGIARLIFGLAGSRIDISKALTVSSVLCVLSYLLAVFAPYPLLSLVGCGLCGLSVGLMWPGTFSLSALKFPAGGTAMFAVCALAGDIGCGAGPGLVGIVAEWPESTGTWASPLKFGILIALIFPVLMLTGVMMLSRRHSK